MRFDPATLLSAKVILVDIRDPYQIWSSRAAALVKKIHFLDGREVTPDDGKVRLIHDGKFIEYHTAGIYKKTKVDELEKLDTEPLAHHITFWKHERDCYTGLECWDTSTETAFHGAEGELLDTHEVVILYCRTGGRSSKAGELILNGSEE